MNDTMVLPVPLTVDEISIHAKELAKILGQKADAEYAMKSYAASCKKQIAEADEKIRELSCGIKNHTPKSGINNKCFFAAHT